jgi:hypothetical protein
VFLFPGFIKLFSGQRVSYRGLQSDFKLAEKRCKSLYDNRSLKKPNFLLLVGTMVMFCLATCEIFYFTTQG